MDNKRARVVTITEDGARNNLGDKVEMFALHELKVYWALRDAADHRRQAGRSKSIGGKQSRTRNYRPGKINARRATKSIGKDI